MTDDPAWQEFRREVFGDPFYVMHDGAQFEVISERYAADPELVLRELRAGLAERDEVAAQACGQLAASEKDQSRLVSMLDEALAGSKANEFRSDVAAALHELGGSRYTTEELAGQVVSVLSAKGWLPFGWFSWTWRIGAARALGEFPPTARLVAAAAAAVRDREYLVRHAAAETLIHWAGSTVPLHLQPELFDLVRSDARPDQWAEAARQLAAAVEL